MQTLFVVCLLALAHGAPLSDDIDAMQRKLRGSDASVYKEEFRRADADHDSMLNEDEFVKFRASRREGGKFIEFHDEKGDKAIPAQFRGDIERTEENTYSFWMAFLNSVAMIIVTELGDKTFFIAAVLAMRHERGVIFLGAIGALALMTVLSALIGFALPSLLPRTYTHYAATILFVYFGFKLLKEGYDMHQSGSVGPSDELEEVEQELKVEDDAPTGAAESGTEKDRKFQREAASKHKKWMNVLTQAFTLTFLAEWGDRSQIATIALASAKDPIGVTIGGILGHAMCTGLAVVGGRLLASRISEKTVAFAGGSLFLVFALHSLWAGA